MQRLSQSISMESQVNRQLAREPILSECQSLLKDWLATPRSHQQPRLHSAGKMEFQIMESRYLTTKFHMIKLQANGSIWMTVFWVKIISHQLVFHLEVITALEFKSEIKLASLLLQRFISLLQANPTFQQLHQHPSAVERAYRFHGQHLSMEPLWSLATKFTLDMQMKSLTHSN